MSKEADLARAAEALEAIKALVESNQSAAVAVDDDVFTLESVVWRSPREDLGDNDDDARRATGDKAVSDFVELAALAKAMAAPSSEIDADSGKERSIGVQEGGGAATISSPTIEPESASIEAAQRRAVPQESVAQQPAHMPSDPYAIYELGDPVYQDRLSTEPTVSRGLPPTQSELMSRAAAHHMQQQSIAEQRSARQTLAPSPHLQPTPHRDLPADDDKNAIGYADFSLDEHEALMSTRLPLERSARHVAPTDPEDAEVPAPHKYVDPVAAQSTTQITTQGTGQSTGQITAQDDEQPLAEPEAAPLSSSASRPTPRKTAPSKPQIPLHVVADNGVAEGDETQPEDVMRNALRSMIRDQIGNWLEDNISELIEDALREPSGREPSGRGSSGREPSGRKKTPTRTTRNTE